MARPRNAIPPKKRRSRKFGKADVGRPTDFKDHMIDQAKQLVALGYTDALIADFFKINPSTLWRWKQAVPDFGRAFHRGEAVQQMALESSMFHRATGYSHKAVKIFPPERITVRSGTGKNRKITSKLGAPIKVEYEEHFPPDPKAAQMLLQKLDPLHYSPRSTLVGDPTQPVQFVMLNRPPKENTHGKTDR